MGVTAAVGTIGAAVVGRGLRERITGLRPVVKVVGSRIPSIAGKVGGGEV